MTFTFKIWDKIKETWPVYKAHFSTFLIMMIITGIIQAVETRDNWPLTIISYAASLLLSFVWIRFILDLIDKKESNPFSRKALPSFSQFWNLFKTTILYILCILAGFVLFVIPAFYVAGRLFFATYLSIEKNQGGRASIKEAWRMTEGYGWKLFWKIFVTALFMMVGFIALFVGVFVTYPIGFVVMVMMYREFMKMKSQLPINATPVEAVNNQPEETVKEEAKKETPIEIVKEEIHTEGIKEENGGTITQ